MLASALALLVASVTPGLHPAAADQFTPLEDPPSIVVNSTNIVVGNPQDSGESIDANMDPSKTGSDEPFDEFSKFQPSSGSSTEIYNVFATITTNGQLANVTRVRFCLYDSKDDEYATPATIDTDCTIPSAQETNAALPELSTVDEPKRLMVMEWQEGETPNIAVVGSNNYEDAGTFFAVGDVTENGDNTRSATIRFSFKVSNAMQVSDGWQIRMAAESQAEIDDVEQGEQSAIDEPATELTVNYFAEMTTNRATTDRTGESDPVSIVVNYGIVVPGVTVLKTGASSIDSGDYTANDVSDLTIVATKFAFDGNDILLAENGDISTDNSDRLTKDESDGGAEVTFAVADAIKNVPNGTVSLDCAFDDNVDLAETGDTDKFVQVITDARVLAAERDATGEGATDLADHSCMLNYPGGGPVANKDYTNTVTLGLTQSVVPAP